MLKYEKKTTLKITIKITVINNISNVYCVYIVVDVKFKSTWLYIAHTMTRSIMEVIKTSVSTKEIIYYDRKGLAILNDKTY